MVGGGCDAAERLVDALVDSAVVHGDRVACSYGVALNGDSLPGERSVFRVGGDLGAQVLEGRLTAREAAPGAHVTPVGDNVVPVVVLGALLPEGEVEVEVLERLVDNLDPVE